MTQQPAPPHQPQPPQKKQGMSGGTIALIIAAVGCLPAVMIIGILAVIAIPNFLQFQCKSKQSEAKTNLAGFFTAEKSFFAEYNAYSTDMVAVNWFPYGSPYYVYGFETPHPNRDLATVIPDFDAGRKDTLQPGVIRDTGGIERYSTLRMVATDGSPLDPAWENACRPDTCTVMGSKGRQGFIAAAYGDIDADSGVMRLDYDTWVINESRITDNTQNDCLQ